MLLRSSSTPVLGSLLPSFGESPSNNNHHHHQPELPTKASSYFHHNYNYCYSKKLSYSNSKHPGSPNLTSSSSYNSSPSIADLSGSNLRRRAQSEGNLEALVSAAATSSNDVDEFSSSKNFVPRHHSHISALEPIPSFSFRNSNARHREDEDSEEEEEEEAFTAETESTTTNLSGESLCVCSSLGNVDFKAEHRRYRNVGFEEQMYLAKGLGIADISFVCDGNQGGGGAGGSGGGEGCKPVAYDGDGGENNNLPIEEHYKRLLEENPGNPLYLRNYAQFLHQTKRDLESADEYYSRAILADPKDGEVLSQYANLIWEFYRNKDRATNYFERAVQASAEDSNVHAAYASFLWEIEDEDEVEASGDDALAVPALVHEGIIT